MKLMNYSFHIQVHEEISINKEVYKVSSSNIVQSSSDAIPAMNKTFVMQNKLIMRGNDQLHN